MRPRHNNNSWKMALIKSLQRYINSKELVVEVRCPLCKKSADSCDTCDNCLLRVVKERLRISCYDLVLLAHKIGFESILEAVKKVPREKLTPSYFKRIGIPKQLHPIIKELEQLSKENSYDATL